MSVISTQDMTGTTQNALIVNVVRPSARKWKDMIYMALFQNNMGLSLADRG